ncbi:hypothetical protein GJ496_011966 [Pomphorhynchus laevis]|nr:hypothetical protein GJ496_011966 [Pomphorhynchus laevis]
MASKLSTDDAGSEGVSDDDVVFSEVKKIKYESTDQVKAITTRCSLSSRKASDMCVTLAKFGVCIATPTQAAFYMANIRHAKRIKRAIIEVIIDVLFLNDGKAETIVNGIVESLKEYGIMKSIKMIVSDTTSVNVGWKNGIVTRLQSRLRNETNEVPQFIGCQHHILDRALRIIMDEYFRKYTVSPEISYEFVSLQTKNYDKLKHDFEQGEFELEAPSGLRDDMRFLHRLMDVYNYYRIHCRFPLVHFHALPNLSSARWNSRATFALLAYILIFAKRLEMKCVCDIICGKDKSSMDIKRSNRCAERVVYKAKIVCNMRLKEENVKLRFILSNDNE